MADAVAEAAHGDEQGGQHEGVDVADPQDLRVGGIQVAADERRGQRQHGAVDADEQDGQDKDGQAQPLAGHEVLTPCSNTSMIMWGKSRPATRPTCMAQPAPATRLYSASVSQAAVRSGRNSPERWPRSNNAVISASISAQPCIDLSASRS